MKSPFPNPAQVWIDKSQFPDAVNRDLARSLATRRFNHKFHYDSVKQAVKWIELHERYSPFRNDPACRATYDRAFRDITARIRSPQVHVISLGSGNGGKEIRLVRTLRRSGIVAHYTPTDVSTAMALIAWKNATRRLGRDVHPPLVFDLATTRNLDALLRPAWDPSARRIITCFGLIPNFEPGQLLRSLAASLRPGDRLLVGANLLPGPSTDAGLRRVLPQYDNRLTREWLTLALSDLGVKRGDGKVTVRARGRASQTGLARIEAHFRFARACQIEIPGRQFRFQARETLRLFFSIRYTPPAFASTVLRYGLRVESQWLAPSGEEGLFLLRKRSK
jgi:uncharacterized SAM-dependent methyltransferase